MGKVEGEMKEDGVVSLKLFEVNFLGSNFRYKLKFL